MPHYAIEYGRRAVRGKVEAASVVVYADGSVVMSRDFPIDKIPYQTNNMDEWLALICREIRPKQLNEIRRMGLWDSIEYIVNDGKGVLKGSAARRNKFTFGISLEERHVGTFETFHQDFRVEVNILTVGYSNLYHKRLKAEGRRAPYLERQAAEDSAEGYFVEGEDDA